MVDISPKTITERLATAQGRVYLGAQVFPLVRDNAIKKGDVLTVAKLAGIMGAKQTGALIPLCHPLALDHVDCCLDLEPETHSVTIQATAKTRGRTGAISYLATR